jgi:tRNA (guanine37-N1)-methyltransferase
MVKFHIFTLFPEALGSYLGTSILGKAQARGLVRMDLHQLRDFSEDKHRTVDDAPYGGGPGMLLRVDVLYRAWASVTGGVRDPSRFETWYMSPQGEVLTQPWLRRESARLGPVSGGGEREVLIFCGHYEGVDERFLELCVDREISIGDYVLMGGELPALVLVEGLVRLLPSVLGSEESHESDSFEGNLLKTAEYTRPRVFQGLSVPEVLLSGDHGRIQAWRREEALLRTQRKRPDLPLSSRRIGGNS